MPEQISAAAADADKGKIAFTQYGCWQCHGFEGQGSVATSNGRVIARTQLPLDAFKAFVRTTNGPMPPFRAAVLSDDDLDDIYAYLQSRPQPKAVERHSVAQQRPRAVTDSVNALHDVVTAACKAAAVIVIGAAMAGLP